MHNGLRAFPALRRVSRTVRKLAAHAPASRVPRRAAAADTLRRLELSHQRLESMSGLPELLRELGLNDNGHRDAGVADAPAVERPLVRTASNASPDTTDSPPVDVAAAPRSRGAAPAGAAPTSAARGGGEPHPRPRRDRRPGVRPRCRRAASRARRRRARVTTRRASAATTRTLPQPPSSTSQVREDERGALPTAGFARVPISTAPVEEARREHAAEVEGGREGG